MAFIVCWVNFMYKFGRTLSIEHAVGCIPFYSSENNYVLSFN